MRAIALVVLLLVPAVASATPADTLAEVQASYANVKGLQGSFGQTVRNATFGTTAKLRGNVYLVRPDKMRWDYAQPNGKGKSIIFDSKTLWIVEPENKQVYQHATVDPTLPAAIAFLNGGGRLAEEFTIRAPKPGTLELVPKQTSAQIKKLTFVIDVKTKRVLRSIVVNHKGDVNTFEFRVADAQPGAKTFEFSPKRVPLYKVIVVQ